MSDSSRCGSRLGARIALGLFFLAFAGSRPANAQCNFTDSVQTFPQIRLCAFPGAYQDSSLIEPKRCIGSFKGTLPDSVAARPRTITLRFRRDRRIEARKDFGGYRIYRVVNYTGPADTSRMVLIRRFSRQSGDERMWNFSVVDTSNVALPFKCKGQVVNDSIVTFVDPDSSGNYVHVCRIRDPQNDLVVTARAASRRHARVHLYEGNFVLIDESANGTYVRFDAQPELHLRREETVLVGHGLIGLGESTSAEGAEPVVFAVQ